MCEDCNEEFEVADNEMGSCCWHDGETAKDIIMSDNSASLQLADSGARELERDWDGNSWADYDESCHGPIDSEEMRSQFAEGFIYDCRDKHGDAEGCTTGRHIEPNFRSKRRHY